MQREQAHSPALAAGAAVTLAGLAVLGTGLWGRREAARALARERIVAPLPPNEPVTDAAGARSLAEFIREQTVQATNGRTYAETEPYVDEGGRPTADEELAARDERTGAPVENPDHDLWIQSTTLQTALMQAYMAFRLAEGAIVAGGGLVCAGVWLAASSRASTFSG